MAEIVDVLGRGLKAWDLEVGGGAAESGVPGWLDGLDVGLDALVEDSVPVDGRGSLGPRQLTDSVLDQLTSYGFGDLEQGDTETPIRSRAFHIEWHNRAKNLSTSEVQRLNGLAAAAGEDVPKRLIVITTASISRPAADFADTARASVFCVDRTQNPDNASNPTAAHYRDPSIYKPRFVSFRCLGPQHRAELPLGSPSPAKGSPAGVAIPPVRVPPRYVLAPAG